jgi:hypothetical protein
VNWSTALLQGVVTTFSAVVVYVLGQVLVKLIEPALALRALIGQIAGDLVMYANRAGKIASNEERLKIFRRHASDLFRNSAAIWCYWLFQFLRIVPPKQEVEEAARLLISFSNSQLAEGAEIIDYLPWETQRDICRLLRITDVDKPKKTSTAPLTPSKTGL